MAVIGAVELTGISGREAAEILALQTLDLNDNFTDSRPVCGHAGLFEMIRRGLPITDDMRAKRNGKKWWRGPSTGRARE
jgi:hypothetical protein